MKRLITLILCLLLLSAALPAAALTGGSAGSDPILAAFPKLTAVEKSAGEFVFAGAPVTEKTRYVLNAKTDERIALHQFKNADDAKTCFSMINGYGLVYKGQFSYEMTGLPYTYYIDAANHRILVYCGSNGSVNKKIAKLGYAARGGYFADRGVTVLEDGSLFRPAGRSSKPGSLKAVLKKTNRILYCEVESAARITDTVVRYKLKTLRGVRNADDAYYGIYAAPGALYVGKSYILFLKQSVGGAPVPLTEEDRGVYTVSADGMTAPGLEVSSWRSVLPAREYGLKAGESLTDCINMLKQNSYYKKVAVPEAVRRAYDGVVASKTAGNVRLDLILPKTAVKAGEAIECYAELTYTGNKSSITVYGEGRPYFGVSGGQYHKGEWMAMLDIVPLVLVRGETVRFPFSKSGVFGSDDRMRAFFTEYFSDPKLRLASGEYEIITHFSYSLNKDYGPPAKVYTMELRAPLRVE